MNDENLKPVEKLTPFTKMIMTIGTLPSSFYASMSYYESMVWLYEYLKNQIIPAVNNNAEAVEELQAKYIEFTGDITEEVSDFKEYITGKVEELETYMNNYFDNLDVQQEINNKLDAMAQDGTLTLLIKNYVDPIYQEYETRINADILSQNNKLLAQDDKIDEINDKVNSATSGTPIPVASTSDMTDTSKLYLNTTDGYWYYYDTGTTSWVQGGIYQSAGITDGSITYNNLESELRNSFSKETAIIDDTQATIGKCILTDGTEYTSTSTQYISIDVEPYDTYVIDLHYNTATFSTNNPVYMFKYNDSVVSYKTGAEVSLDENSHFKAVLDIPLGVDELILNSSNSTNIKDSLFVVKVDKYSINNIVKSQLGSKLQSIFTDVFEEITPTLFINGAYLGNNSVDAISGFKIYSVECNPDEIFRITAKQIYGNPLISFGNPNSSKTYNVGGTDYTIQSIASTIKGTDGQEFTDYVFTIPKNCNTFYFNQEGSRTFKIEKSTSYKVKVEDLDVSEAIQSLNPLHNKTIMFVGDSICAASTAGVKGWTGLIAENNPTATIYNYGQDGATIADDGNDTNNVITKIQTMYVQHPTADYIIIQGGVNDAWQHIPLGTYSPNSNFNGGTAYDQSTFSGALEWILHYAITHFGGKKIGFICSQKIYISDPFYEYMQRAKDICKKWCIPYIDLYDEGNLNFYITEQKQNYSITNVDPTGDGCHPNLAGYQIISPKIENWLKYKI